MIKVLVVVWGLVLFVPDAPDTAHPAGLTALVLDTDAWSHIPEHRPRFLQHGADLGTPSIDRDFDIVLRVPGSAPVELGGLPHLVALDRLTDRPDQAVVRADCLRRAPSCSFEGRPMVAGKIRFEGAWSTRPVSKCTELELPLGYRDQALWDFRPANDLGQPGDSRRRLATALAFEAEVVEIDDAVIEITVGGTNRRVALFESAAEVCADFLGEAGRCAVLELANGVSELPRIRCTGGSDDPPECRGDRHFAAFYDLLLSPGPDPRLIPFVVENYLECDSRMGIGNMPSVRCPPPVALPERAVGGNR